MPVESAPVSDVNEQARAPQARATGFTPVKTGRVKYLLWKWRRTLDSFGAKAGPAARPVALSPAKSFFLPLLPPLLPHGTRHHRVGQRMPAWAQAAWDDCAKRFPPELKVQLKATKAEPRV